MERESSEVLPSGDGLILYRLLFDRQWILGGQNLKAIRGFGISHLGTIGYPDGFGLGQRHTGEGTCQKEALLGKPDKQVRAMQSGYLKVNIYLLSKPAAAGHDKH